MTEIFEFRLEHLQIGQYDVFNVWSGIYLQCSWLYYNSTAINEPGLMKSWWISPARNYQTSTINFLWWTLLFVLFGLDVFAGTFSWTFTALVLDTFLIRCYNSIKKQLLFAISKKHNAWFQMLQVLIAFDFM